jgi:gamma-glutamyltranspeptidase/glutathione hydrolase
MVASPHSLASDAGLHVLQDGGSAMDAAIAANAVLTVIYPDQTSIGGDCFFMVFDPSTGEVPVWNGSGPAPAAASAEELLEQGYTGMPRRGPYTVTVPGTIDAWFAGHSRFGKLEMSRILQPAIDYARNGFPVSPRLAAAVAVQSEILPQLPYVGEVMMPGGVAPAAGDYLQFPRLASSLETIAREGRDSFYGGQLGEAIIGHMRDLDSWLAMEDLTSYRGEWATPLSIDYRGTTVLQCPPNSQGITALIELGLVRQEAAPGRWGELESVHAQIEAKKRAFRIRDTKIADPRFVGIDTAQLLSRPFLADLWQDFSPDSIATGQADRPGDTVHICAIDQDGMAVSLIQSMYQAFGSGVADPETGIILHNRGTYFSLNPQRVNVLEPNKRPLHTLMPGMLLRNGTLLGSFGTQGGDVQAQVHLQLVSDVIDLGLDPQQAIDAPRWLAGGPDGPHQVLLEQGFPMETIEGLAIRGHQLTIIDPWNPGAGHAQMIMVDTETGILVGGADGRADGSAAGY